MPRFKVSPEDSYPFYEAGATNNKTAELLGIDYRTVRRWWCEHYGEEAVKARGKLIQKASASKLAKERDRSNDLSHIENRNCEDCDRIITLTIRSIGKLKRLVCKDCENKAHKRDRQCPVCATWVAGLRGLSRHMRSPSKREEFDYAAHARFLEAENLKDKWAGKIEGVDYVECQVCGKKAKSLTGHIGKHSIKKEEYYQKFPNHSLCSDSSAKLKGESLKSYANLTPLITLEQLELYKDGQGKVSVAKAVIGLGKSQYSVLDYCRKYDLPTQNNLSWQRLVLDEASKYLGPYEWEWQHQNLVNSESGRKYRYDGYFPSENLILEAQGEQHFRFSERWHGTLEVFHEQRSKDQDKRKLALEAGYKYLTIRPRDPVMDSDFWARILNGDSVYWGHQTEEQKDATITSVLSNLRKFPFPELRTPWKWELKKSATVLTNYEIKLDESLNVRPYTVSGVSVCGRYFPNRLRATHHKQRSAYNAWHDDELLKKAIRLQLDSGDPVTPERVLKAVILFTRTPSVFRPGVAKWVYTTYANKGTVWDPCAGYGSRLFAAHCAGIERYIGCDIEPDTVIGNLSIARDLDWGDHCVVECLNAATFDPGIPLDLVFTSPPYFDVEHYGSEFEKTIAGSFDDWRKSFLKPVIETAHKRLKPGGHLVLNLPSKPVKNHRLDLEADEIARTLNFVPQETVYMPLRNQKREPILIWQKALSVETK